MLEHAIAAKLVALGVDWQDEQALRSLAQAIFVAQQGDREGRLRALYSRTLKERLITELAGLSQLMLRIMALSARNFMLVLSGKLLPVRSIRRRNGLVPFRQPPQGSDGWQQVTFYG